MNAIISTNLNSIDELKSKLSKVPSMEGLELSSFVSTKKIYTLGDNLSEYRVAVIDFGVKKNILKCLENRGVFKSFFL